jgi:hypothetical protein
VGDRVYPIRPPPCSSAVCLTNLLDMLASPVLAAPPSLDLVPQCCSSTCLLLRRRTAPVPLLPLAPLPFSHRCRSAAWPAVESQDPGAQSLPDGAAKRASHQVPGCRTDSIDPTAYWSPMSRLQWMGAPTAAVVEVRQGSVRSVKAAVMALSKAQVALGVGPLDQW